jgi:hypothetical protein
LSRAGVRSAVVALLEAIPTDRLRGLRAGGNDVRLRGKSWLGAGPRLRGEGDGKSVPCAPTADGGGNCDPPHKHGDGAGVAAPPPQVIPTFIPIPFAIAE